MMMHEDYHINHLKSIKLKAIQCGCSQFTIEFDEIFTHF